MKNKLICMTLFLLSIIFSANVFSDVVIERTPENYVEVNDTVYWTCTSRPQYSNYPNVCYIDIDGIGSNYEKTRFYTSVNTRWSQSGVYQVSTGRGNCDQVSCSASTVSMFNDDIIVAPSGGWPLNISANKLNIYAGESISFTSNSSASVNCCVFQWDFGDGTDQEDYQTDGSSSISHTYSRAGNYTASVLLETKLDEDITDINGNKVRRTINISVQEKPKPLPEPVTNFEASILKSGYQVTPVYSNDQQGILWYNHHTDLPNSFYIRWDKPSDAKTRIEYRVDFGTVGKNAQHTDIGWTEFATHSTSATSSYLSALTPPLVTLNYNNELGVPWERYDPLSQDYVMVYYRMRSENANGVSEWKYLRGIWYWYKD